MSDLETRMRALEAEVARLREDGATTRAIAALADRDVAEVRTTQRANTQLLTALRETQVEQGRTLTGHTQTLHGLAEAVGGLTVQVQQLATGQARHDQLLEHLTQAVTGLTTGQQQLTQAVATLTTGQARHDQILTEHGQALTDIAATVHRLADDT